jgi:amidase
MVRSKAPPRWESPHWESIASAKRLAIYSEIPQKWRLSRSVIRKCRTQKCIAGVVIEKLLDQKSRRTTALDTEKLLGRISSGALTAEDVTRAFCKRTAYAHQLVRPGRRVLRLLPLTPAE